GRPHGRPSERGAWRGPRRERASLRHRLTEIPGLQVDKPQVAFGRCTSNPVSFVELSPQLTSIRLTETARAFVPDGAFTEELTIALRAAGVAGSTGWLRSQATSARSSIGVARNKDRTLNMEALPSSRFRTVERRPRDHLTLDGRAIGIARSPVSGLAGSGHRRGRGRVPTRCATRVRSERQRRGHRRWSALAHWAPSAESER